jgi:hypothetical protein
MLLYLKDQYIYIHECLKAFITTDEEEEEEEEEGNVITFIFKGLYKISFALLRLHFILLA